MDAGITITEVARSELDELEPLWNALREHHLAVGPGWLPAPHSRADSWRLRRAEYEDVLNGDGDAFGLVARRGGAAVGYAMVRVRATSPTWQFGERAGEVETLAVLPNERGHGLGHRLLEEVYRRLRALGVAEVGLHVLAGNDGALRFYAREGFNPYAVALSRRL